MNTDKKVYVFAQVKAKPGREAQLREALLRLVKVSEKEPGFIRYDLHEHHSEKGSFAFYETWEDQAALDVHSSTPEMKAHSDLTSDWVESVTVEVFHKIS